MTALHLLMHQGSEPVSAVTTNAPQPQSLVTPANIARLKGIPIFLFSGADNKTLTPESTEMTYEILRQELGSQGGIVKRRVFEGYGHLDPWIGKQAYRDCWPAVLEEVEAASKK